MNGDEWQHIYVKTDTRSSGIYKAAARMGGAGKYLIRRVNRKGVAETMQVLHGNQVVIDKLARMFREGRLCKTCRFTEDYMTYYKLDNFIGNMGKAELRVVRNEIETDTGSTEREHSHNQRRARFRVWTHAQPISNLSCFFTSHKCGEWKWEESDNLRKQCMLTDKPKEHVTKRCS